MFDLSIRIRVASSLTFKFINCVCPLEYDTVNIVLFLKKSIFLTFNSVIIFLCLVLPEVATSEIYTMIYIFLINSYLSYFIG